ncbi:DUF4403 family protein [Amphritea balenae]|uniref:DUF4403 family protein n=1 Tax=Amphritea balenae TaxID=452629 RepID=A0A3P1SK40_9GAMM|nr:DUF4403 family protein [Amphritea balenae]RRC97115.1 DUF4403 family protein [Amphritea balenae]GGK68098.1 hypothetical protein GCM10007941_17870 [Amphritea balenae]
MKKLLRALSIAASLLAITGCDNIGSIGVKPERQYQEYKYEIPDSSLAIKVGVNLDEVEKVIESKFSSPISGEEKGEFSETYTLKTNDPLYHPREWIKTKDPLYNPNKWIEKCVSYNAGFIKDKRCVKTKNPLYHPRKWIKTKDPLYHPSKWIYSSAKVDIGYKAKYEVGLARKIEFEGIAGNKLKITVPITAKGKAGFRGDIAKIGLLDNKNFDVDVNVEFLVGLNFNREWCPVLSVDTYIDWEKGPRIEIVGNTWLDFNVAAQIANLGLQPMVTKAIEGAIDCATIKNEIDKLSVPSNARISTEHGDYSFGIQPIDIFSPNIFFSDKNLEMSIGAKLKMGVEFGYTPKTIGIPQLTPSSGIENIIDINLPFVIPYKELHTILDAKKGTIESELNALIKTQDEISDAEVSLKGIEIYPNKEKIVIGIDFKLEVGSFFKPSGTIYLTALPVISENHVFSLEKVKINGKLENPAYAAVVNLIKQHLEASIEEKMKFKLGPRIEELKLKVLAKVQEELKAVNGVEVKIVDPKIRLSDEIVNVEGNMVKNISLLTGVDVIVKPLALVD